MRPLFVLSAVTATALAACPRTPSTASFNDTKLPDPFRFIDGKRVRTVADWECRAAEISHLFQTNELGTIPGRPQHVSGTLSGNTLTVNVTNAGKNISFAVTLNVPTTGSGPFPAIIAFGGLSIPALDGVGSIIFNNNDIALQNDQSSRGVGKFYTLFGADHPAGAMAAWAWAVSRIIDALETTRDTHIDVRRLAVTGCSRNGKGALVAGAFDPRIALVIPQESGSGGAGCWRISDVMLAGGIVTQTASEIVQENVWFGPAFDAFSNNVPALPVDHHLLAGMVAPRGLFVIENTFFDWLGPESTLGCMSTGQEVFKALRVPDHMGFKAVNHSDHCAFPAAIQPQLTAFFNRFLLRTPANTTVFTIDGNVTFPRSDFIDWSTPILH
ncbi:hypothetical protein AURDEDRAFT_135043 [Auricularia subglabra TFB-10046 SS5]|nr:hypothetical protein AURDEDRAFT_135043 [Auricularia subglabra TFB-10046 SS5]